MTDDRAKSRRGPRWAAAFVALGLTLPLVAEAQFSSAMPGIMNLPAGDFTWTWGRHEDAQLAERPDISVDGFDSEFRCKLEAEFSPSVNMTYPEIRDYEQSLRSAGFFIATVTNEMNELDRYNRIRWAKLDCVMPEETERTAEERAEREAELREKAERKRDRRREREGNEEIVF